MNVKPSKLQTSNQVDMIPASRAEWQVEYTVYTKAYDNFDG